MSQPISNEPSDPFQGLTEVLQDIAEGQQAMLIEVMRLYDVQMSLLTMTNPDLAQELHKRHAEGKIVGPMPVFDYSQQESEGDDEV